MSIVLAKKVERGVHELESFISQARKKLLEFEVLQSALEIKQGKGKVYRSAHSFIKSLRRQ